MEKLKRQIGGKGRSGNTSGRPYKEIHQVLPPRERQKINQNIKSTNHTRPPNHPHTEINKGHSHPTRTLRTGRQLSRGCWGVLLAACVCCDMAQTPDQCLLPASPASTVCWPDRQRQWMQIDRKKMKVWMNMARDERWEMFTRMTTDKRLRDGWKGPQKDDDAW